MNKIVLSAIGLVSCGLLLTSCQKTENITEPEVTQVEQNTSNGQKETVELTVWGSEEDQTLLHTIIDNFVSEHSKEADLQITVAVQSEVDCRDIFLSDIEAGADVISIADDQIRAMVAGGGLQPVENVDEIKSRNLEASVEAGMVNDVLYAYPMTADNGYFLYYNNEYFTQQDIQSLDKMLDIAAENGKKITMDFTSGWYMYSFFGQSGLEVGLNPDGVTNYCNWNATDTNVKGADIVQSMLNVATHPGFASKTDAEVSAEAGDGEIIACVSGTWNALVLQQAWGSHYAADKLPTYECGGKQVQMSSFAGYKFMAVNAYSKHIEWAQKLADYITNEQNQNLRFEMRGQGPSNINAADSEEVSKSVANQALLKQSEFAQRQIIGGNYWTPMEEYGVTLMGGNPYNEPTQDIIDRLVTGITASTAQ